MVHVLFYFHLASWPRLFYLLLAPTCFRFSGLNLSFLFVTLPGFFLQINAKSFLFVLPCGRPRFWKIAFVCIYLTSSKWQKNFIWVDLSLGSVLDSLVLKNNAECTSRRVKRTSGARDMINSLLKILVYYFSTLLGAKNVKTQFVCTVFTVQFGPRLLKLTFCVVFFELGWGWPRSVFPASV